MVERLADVDAVLLQPPIVSGRFTSAPLPAPGAACAPPELCLHVHGGPAHEVSVVMLSVACPFEAFNRGAAAGHAWLLDCVLLLS